MNFDEPIAVRLIKTTHSINVRLSFNLGVYLCILVFFELKAEVEGYNQHISIIENLSNGIRKIEECISATEIKIPLTKGKPSSATLPGKNVLKT